MKEKPSLDFTFHSKLLSVIKENDNMIVNLWKPIKDGKRLIWMYNNHKNEHTKPRSNSTGYYRNADKL